MQPPQRRRKRNVRDSGAPSMALTERDKQIIEAVYLCRVLRQDQIHSLFFGSSKTASQRRLSLLYHHGFLARKFLTVHASYLLSPTLYLLDKRGADVLRAEFGYETLYWRPSDNAVEQLFLEHTLAINDVRVAVTVASRQLGYELLTWRGEAEMKADYDRVAVRDSTGRRRIVSLIPDSYFVLNTPRGRTHFFLELDRGRMTTAKFKEKIRAYLTYYDSGAYEERYGTKSLRVLTVVPSQKRLESLKHTTEDAGGIDQFWFTTLPTITPQTVLSVPIWQVACETEPAILIESL